MNPWARFEQASCYPQNCQCEAARDAIIRQPSAFWSSFAYIIAAIAIYRHIKTKTFELKMWALVCVVMGLSSLMGHGTFTKLTLSMDFAAIILVLSFFALLNLFLLLKQSPRRILIYFSAYYVTIFFALYSMDKWTRVGICVLIFFFSIGDLIREIGCKFIKARTLQICLLILTCSFGLFLLDEAHYQCDPNSLFQLHSIWHMGTALSIYFYGKWRFEVTR